MNRKRNSMFRMVLGMALMPMCIVDADGAVISAPQKVLYFNPATNVVFGSDAPQDPAIEVITADKIADLIANGATVDASADQAEITPGNAMPVASEVTSGATGSDTASVSSGDDSGNAVGAAVDGAPEAGGVVADGADLGNVEAVTGSSLLPSSSTSAPESATSGSASSTGIASGSTLSADSSAETKQNQLGAEDTGATDVHPISTDTAPALGDTGPNGTVWPAASAHASSTALSAGSASLAGSVAETAVSGSVGEQVREIVSHFRAHLWTFETSAVQRLHADLDRLEDLFE
jgi:hypothetical protein